MKRYPRGSEWRKWDLHLHFPGTKLSDGYGSEPDWDAVCRIVEESDVAVFGVTDYFSFDSYYSVIDQFEERYPNANKTFFPNLELRLNETVNKQLQHVNFHLIFRPSVPRHRLNAFLHELKTEIYDERGRPKSCAELHKASDFESAVVTRQNVIDALEATFGRHEHRSQDVVTAVPANNDGIRAESGVARKANLADQIDRLSDVILGSQKNADYFLRTDRLEDGSHSVPKPVFSGSDAHSLEQLTTRLGKAVKKDGFEIEPTWVKADPTFDGLLQTLVEPRHRVRIQTTRPDPREPYQYISKVRFTGSSDFPSEIELNSNLVSIIGARSSGKSSLLAYIAHAVDPDHVVEQQVAAGGAKDGHTGPAAGKSWQSVQHIKCSVEWGDAAAKSGRVIYIPQNSLYAISERPDEITAKVEPAIHRLAPDFATYQRQVGRDVSEQNEIIGEGIRSWFSAQANIHQKESLIRDLGDKAGVESERRRLDTQIAALQVGSQLTPEELAQYSTFLEHDASRQSQIRSTERSASLLDTYVVETLGDERLANGVDVEVSIRPNVDDFPPNLRASIENAVQASTDPLRAQIEELILAYRAQLRETVASLRSESRVSQEQNRDLIAKNLASSEINELVKRRQKQDEVLVQISSIETDVRSLVADMSELETAIVESLAKRTKLLDNLQSNFQETVPASQSGMIFGLETELSGEAIEVISRSFNLRDRSEYVDRDRSGIRVDYAQNQPVAFMTALLRGDQKLRQGEDVQSAVTRVLTATPQIRFYASLDGDRIGGFRPSSMTPGKQALFALTLILDESDEPWPLLIDQPEDDLDSRSVYDQIVPYLIRRKQERQILMVTHNANLVVGADSEQVIVSNRHGDDRKNPGGQTFCYLSGSLEHSAAKVVESEFVLDACGVREHTCEILDGGSEAFRKRMDKYKIAG